MYRYPIFYRWLFSHNHVKYKYRLTSLCARCYSYRMVVVGYAVFFVFPHSAPCMRLSSHTALPRWLITDLRPLLRHSLQAPSSLRPLLFCTDSTAYYSSSVYIYWCSIHFPVPTILSFTYTFRCLLWDRWLLWQLFVRKSLLGCIIDMHRCMDCIPLFRRFVRP